MAGELVDQQEEQNDIAIRVLDRADYPLRA